MAPDGVQKSGIYPSYPGLPGSFVLLRESSRGLKVENNPSNPSNPEVGRHARVCSECGGPRHGTILERRERATRIGLERWIRSLHPLAWERFGDLFAFDVDALMARLPGRIVLLHGEPQETRPRCVGTICRYCGAEDYNPKAATRAKKGIDYPCDKCGAEYGLARVYRGNLYANEVIRILFPWSGAGSPPSSPSTSPFPSSPSPPCPSTSPGGTG